MTVRTAAAVAGATASGTAAGRATATATAPSAPSSRLSTESAQLTTLDSGVRVVTEAMPSVRSIALGFWVRAGSRDEGDEQAGISHFLEHLLFKGTERFSSREIDELFDAMGAEVNAGTGKETTSVHSRFLDGHLERAFDVLQDMVLRPAYPDIDSERQVVIEEIAMYEDEPSDKVHDVLAGADLRRPPARPADHRHRRRRRARCRSRRSPPGTTGAMCPATSWSRRPATSSTSGSCRSSSPPSATPRRCPWRPAPPHERRRRSCASTRRRPSNTTSVSAARARRGDERRFALRILDTIFGGSTSSRLFQEVREKRGLAYAVYSYASHYYDSGQVAVYVGTRPDNVDRRRSR